MRSVGSVDVRGDGSSGPQVAPVYCKAADLHIDVRNNGSTGIAQPHLCTHIQLSRNWVGADRAVQLARALASSGRAAREPLGLVSFEAAWCFGNEGAVQVAALIRKSRSLRIVRLRWNSMSEDAAIPLGRSLRSRGGQYLVEFDVGGNWLRNAGAKLLSRSLYSHPSLSVLRLDLNGIQSGGAGALAQAIGNNSHLHVIDLSGNTIGNKGVVQLAEQVERGAGGPLMSVSLQLNHLINDNGAMAFARALHRAPALLQLDLGGNKIANEGAAILLAAAQRSNLAELWIDDNVGEKCRPYIANISRSFGTCRSGDKGRTKSADFNTSILWAERSWRSGLRARREEAGRHFTWWRAPLRASVQREQMKSTRVLAATFSSSQIAAQAAYHSRVYPLAVAAAKTMKPLVLFTSAPPSMLPNGCEGHSWRFCRLDSYFDTGRAPPRIPYGSYFAPFRLPPGMCMRSEFSWDTSSRDAWAAGYTYSSGVQDHHWVEVAHTREQMGGAWLYLAPGSGVFWNCGRSLRARNKVAAALRLVDEAHKVKSYPRLHKVGTAAETLARGIQSDEKVICFGSSRCRLFMTIFNSNRTNKNDNCYGQCSPGTAPLSSWLDRASNASGAIEWQIDQMSASSVLDRFISHWALRLGYDSIQLTHQPQVWCGLGWTTEMLDLHVREHRATDLIQRLSVRDPDDPSTRGEPCVVRQDNASRRAFQLCIYCEGGAMEQTSRCLHDASRNQRGFTVYSQYPRHRYDACLAGL
eukprot:CAMPEP_0115858986 /NCGR_PEP_ID=MMETSP0287-20121206/16380_1 /TAXON_ID=412157 /ORGANISM="Chrysochromulina rotalis, Strain UIO044" /LENGTH=750 /DNA_ID=CAMNT_0003313267 /DNA_START=1 /DNA_END=2253 /DNA_ORIENTATION=-